MTIHIAIVTHRSGCNTYASEIQETVLDALENYCKGEWSTEDVPGEPDADVVTRYFAHVEHESYIIDETELL